MTLATVSVLHGVKYWGEATLRAGNEANATLHKHMGGLKVLQL